MIDLQIAKSFTSDGNIFYASINLVSRIHVREWTRVIYIYIYTRISTILFPHRLFFPAILARKMALDHCCGEVASIPWLALLHGTLEKAVFIFLATDRPISSTRVVNRSSTCPIRFFSHRIDLEKFHL